MKDLLVLVMIGFHRGKLLQTSLIAEYKRKLKSGEDTVSAKDKSKLPVALAGVHVKCYACGGGHNKWGDPACKAGPKDVPPDAPQHFKLRQAAKKGKAEVGGKGNAKHENDPKKQKKDGEKKHCH
jgi:hypothetical protein